MKHRLWVLPFFLLFSAVLWSCGASLRSEQRAASLRAAQQQAQSLVHSEVLQAQQHTMSALEAELHARIFPVWRHEGTLSDWLEACKESLGAIAHTPVDAIESCEQTLETLRPQIRALLAYGSRYEATGYTEALEAFVDSGEQFLRARRAGYRTPDSHAHYASMIDQYNAWVEEAVVLRRWVLEHPEAVLAPLP